MKRRKILSRHQDDFRQGSEDWMPNDGGGNQGDFPPDFPMELLRDDQQDLPPDFPLELLDEDGQQQFGGGGGRGRGTWRR